MMRGTFIDPCRHTNPGLAISSQLSLQILLEDDTPIADSEPLKGRVESCPARVDDKNPTTGLTW